MAREDSTTVGLAHSKSFSENAGGGIRGFFYDMFTYSTVRSATIKSKRVGIAYRLVQFLLLFYIIGWDLFHKKGYQEFDTVSSVVTTKVKGQGFVPVNATIDRSVTFKDPQYLKKVLELNPNKTYKILDTADYIVPPNEYNSIFIMSNYIQTVQTQGVCDEEISKLKAECTKDEDCQNLGTFMNAWNGIPTGRCIQSSVRANKSTCEVKGWCPTEHDNDRHEDTLIRNVLNYTIFIKNDIEFKKFRKKQRNIASNLTNKYISQCTYEDRRDHLCPVFQLNYIMDKAEPDPAEKYKMLVKGGVIVVEIIWNCDFDFNDNCLPKYVFSRFDTKETNTASGFNFRFANKYAYEGKEQRVLYKAYGIRIIINVSGTAGKFAIIPLMMTIGTGFGLMSISVIVADCVMLHCTKKKSLYQKIKEFDLKEKETSLNDGTAANNNNESH